MVQRARTADKSISFPGNQSWQDVLDACPSLARLADAARCGGDWQSWRIIKASLARYVGWDADTRAPLLLSQAAYQVAYRHLIGLFEMANELVARHEVAP